MTSEGDLFQEKNPEAMESKSGKNSPPELDKPSEIDIMTANEKILRPASNNNHLTTLELAFADSLEPREPAQDQKNTNQNKRIEELRRKTESGAATDKEFSELNRWEEFPNNARGRALLEKLEKDKVLSKKESAELAGLRFSSDNPEAAKLFEKKQYGTISKEEKSKLIAWQEFKKPETGRARELVVKEIEGKINPDEHAELGAWRVFSDTHQNRARDLAKKDLLNNLTDKQEIAELQSWRKFPRKDDTHARELVQRELLGKGNPQESREIDLLLSKPHTDEFSILSISDKHADRIEQLDKKIKSGQFTRKDLIEHAQLEEFPDNPRGQELLQKVITKALDSKESAELFALRHSNKDPILQQLIQKERLGQISQMQKIELESQQEFFGKGPHVDKARQLAKLETLGQISPQQKGLLTAYREFNPEVADSPDYMKALEYVQKEYAGKLTPAEAAQLHTLRIASTSLLPPPEPPR